MAVAFREGRYSKGSTIRMGAIFSSGFAGLLQTYMSKSPEVDLRKNPLLSPLESSIKLEATVHSG